MKASKPHIVADGPQRYRAGNDYRAVRQRVLAEATQRYEAQLKQASFWGRCWLEVKIRREVRAALEKQFPSASLHLASTASR